MVITYTLNKKQKKKKPSPKEAYNTRKGKSRFVEPLPIQSKQILGGHSEIESIVGDALRKDPYRWICYLVSQFNNGAVGFATGSLIGPNAVITSGHALMTRFPKQTGNVIWAISTSIFPCKQQIFGQRTSLLTNNQSNNQIFVLSEWRDQVNAQQDESLNRSNDIGILKFNEPFVSPEFDYGNFEILEDTSKAKDATIAGFTKESIGMLTTAGAFENDQSNPGTIRYQMDSIEGMSGSPLYEIRDGVPYLVAVHSYGASNANYATLLTNSIQSTLQDVIS